jgi:hypothetical protein
MVLGPSLVQVSLVKLPSSGTPASLGAGRGCVSVTSLAAAARCCGDTGPSAQPPNAAAAHPAAAAKAALPIVPILVMAFLRSVVQHAI